MLTSPKLCIVGSTRTPFAVSHIALCLTDESLKKTQIKGGGHTANPKFSSTTGVQISMYRFSDVVYNPDSQTADIGAGLIWDDVYAALEPHGVNVVGGRVRGIGVAGFTLGGGSFIIYGRRPGRVDTNYTMSQVIRGKRINMGWQSTQWLRSNLSSRMEKWLWWQRIQIRACFLVSKFVWFVIAIQEFADAAFIHSFRAVSTTSWVSYSIL